MKIGPSSADDRRVEAGGLGAERALPTRPGSVSEPVAAPASVERISLRGAGVAFVAAAAPAFNDRKVEEVRQAIAEGRFPVDARRVADQLIADSRELFGLAAAGR